MTQTREKYSRVLAFSVPAENGAFRLQGRAGQVDAGQQELWDELVAFPAGEHDDLLDAAAMGTAYLLDRPGRDAGSVARHDHGADDGTPARLARPLRPARLHPPPRGRPHGGG